MGVFIQLVGVWACLGVDCHNTYGNHLCIVGSICCEGPPGEAIYTGRYGSRFPYSGFHFPLFCHCIWSGTFEHCDLLRHVSPRHCWCLLAFLGRMSFKQPLALYSLLLISFCCFGCNYCPSCCSWQRLFLFNTRISTHILICHFSSSA